MYFSRFLKVSMVATSFMLIAPFSFAGSKVATEKVANPASTQKVIAQLQAQIQQVANSVPKQLAKQNAANQKAILNLQKQTQAQFAHLQSEITQLQAQMTKEIAQVQKEVQQEARIK